MRIAWKVISLLVLLVVLNAIYTRHSFEAFAEDHADQYLQVKKIRDCDAIYISASSNFPPEHIEENDPRKISQFIADHFPSMQFEAINKPASHAGIYLPLMEMIAAEGDAHTFIVTMNLRSFGPSWIDSDLETALQQAKIFYNNRPPLINRFLLSLNAYDNLSQDERRQRVLDHWENDPLPFEEPKDKVNAWCAVEKWGDWRDPKRQLADQFIKQYGFVIDEDNPRVKDFDQIVMLANEQDWAIVFNLLAENVETADSLVGDELSSLMRENANWLIERYQNKGITVVDNLEVLGEERFTDKDFPTEHYDEQGRRTIAQNVAKALKVELEKKK